MKTFRLTIAKIGENLFDGEAVSVTLPGSDGFFTVLAGHQPLVSELEEGEVRVEGADGETRLFQIPEHGGVAEISDNQAAVLL